MINCSLNAIKEVLPVSKNKEGKRRCEQYNFNTSLHHHILNENHWYMLGYAQVDGQYRSS
jgi:hypothetical protein